MLNIIQKSKNDKSISNSAAAAVTAISLYNPLLSAMNFSKISIPNAYLSYAYL
jgi:hypothetical protein